MPALTKTLPTNSIEIVIRGGKPAHFVGPKSNLKPLLSTLDKFKFHPVKGNSNETTVSWEKLAAGRIKKFTKPGLALRGARLKEGFTQVELAKKIGVAQYNLSKMEKGERPIGRKMAMRLGKVLKIDYRVFL